MSQLSILVVDPDPISQKILGTCLGKAQVEVDIVETGQLCLKKVREKNYECLLIECHLSDTDTFDLVRQIREGSDGESIFIIAMTADVVRMSREKCLANGMDAYFPKPMEMECLFKMLKSIEPNHESEKTYEATGDC